MSQRSSLHCWQTAQSGHGCFFMAGGVSTGMKSFPFPPGMSMKGIILSHESETQSN
jgi:hypothetical protein